MSNIKLNIFISIIIYLNTCSLSMHIILIVYTDTVQRKYILNLDMPIN